MRCEVCGRKIHVDPIRVNIEGAKLTVCAECAKHGKTIYPNEENPVPKSPFLIVTPGSSLHSTLAPSTGAKAVAAKAKKPQQPQMVQKKRNLVAKVEITQELVEGYAAIIRMAREKLGYSHEELGLKINERASVLKHVELSKMEPNNLLASKLERALKITLLVPIEEEKPVPATVAGKNQDMTLGDLIEIDSGSSSEEHKGRKLS
ncbi:MAG: multiprotein bridging factor aMBF1 [Candidatus Bathyarchaeota archaeon]|nr:multiprotein bridging factor aMBF1 [Candidatus Termiticorpusculum sp.]MCL1971334.1 multiprotein bridging factor aMBF1 [Candidatus Termiticorpusculum sp.]